jgi:ribosome-binding factor A
VKEKIRPKKVGDVVRAELARILREDLRDPAIGFATITDVSMSDDLRSARVFVSVFGGPEKFHESVAALNHARSRLRGIVGRNCKLRFAPDLHFVEDHTIERGARIEELLRTIPAPQAASGEPAEPEAPEASEGSGEPE